MGSNFRLGIAERGLRLVVPCTIGIGVELNVAADDMVMAGTDYVRPFGRTGQPKARARRPMHSPDAVLAIRGAQAAFASGAQ